VRTGSERGGRKGGGRGRSCRTGQGRAPGMEGLISSALALLGQLISARRTRQRLDAAGIREADSRKTGDFPEPSCVVPITAGSRERQTGNVRLLASVSTEECVGCGKCAQVCPVSAIIIDDNVWVNAGRCTGCGLCVAECPQNALALTKAR
jgi:Na+-translocating ferredoxin:NAD+ oxidoreductase RNF subunit RnfB